MFSRSPVIAPPFISAAVLAALAAAALLALPVSGQALAGADLFKANCGGCHELPDPEQMPRAREEWERLVKQMIERGATLNPREARAVVDYLDGFNRAARRIQWNRQPAASHTLRLSDTDARIWDKWVDLVTGGDARIEWQVRPASPGSALLQPERAPASLEIPLFVDNSGTFSDGSLQARLQLTGGSATGGGGILFGFRDPQNFFGIRMSSRDLILFEVRSGQRALLGRTPMAIPLKQWHDLRATISARQLTVTLDEKPLANLSRQLDQYRGGLTGLLVQGEASAAFETWSVSVKP